MKHQVIVIHGGDSFRTNREYINFLKKRNIDFARYRLARSDWKRTLGIKLGKTFEVIQPDMPNKQNAKYVEWKIWFEKFIPYLNREVILVGHSLGGLFLAKYLSENKFPKKVRATLLVAPPFGSRGFMLPKNLHRLERQGGKIVIFHSKDDRVVPFRDFGRYRKLLPGAVAKVFRDRGHFKQEKFPELVNEVRDSY